MKRKCIINPASGKGLNKRTLYNLKQWFNKNTGAFDHVLTKNAEDIAIQTRKALHDGVEQIIVLGGDGTNHHVVNAFFENDHPINPDARLVISQMGSGSDYYKTVVFEKNVQNWMDLVLEHKVKCVDVGHASLMDKNGNVFDKRYFINLATTGMSAEIVSKKENMPKFLPGSLKYFTPTLTSLATYKPVMASITLEKKTIEDEILALFISKGFFGGGGMRFGNEVKIDDGKFEITAVSKMSPADMIFKLPKLYTGKYNGVKEIEKHMTSSILVKADAKMSIELDGEYMGKCDFEIVNRQKIINICFPKG